MSSKNIYLTLSCGTKIPLIGLGTSAFQNKPGEVKDAVKVAIDAGYRHFDTAYVYKTECELGEAFKEKIQDGIVKREDLFVTTKLWATFHRPDKVEYAVRLSLKELQLDYVDLFLMHSPMAAQYKGDNEVFPRDEKGETLLDDFHYTETWKEVEKLVEKGITKSIGVSNFNVAKLKELLKITKVPIAMLQVENHPFIDQSELIDFCKSKNITITAFSPLGSSERPWAPDKGPNIREHPLIKEVADSKGCSTAQLLIAYNLCQGIVCIPKSCTPSRIQENFMALEIKLSEEEIEKLDSLAELNYRFAFWN